jgi:hypothetical protein
MTDTDIKRQAVMATEAYRSGRTFLSSDMRPIMAKALDRPVDIHEASTTLYGMRADGLLQSTQSIKGKAYWFGPRPHKLSEPWRNLSNRELGITESHGLGWTGN